jgi:hypothetical protein
MGKDQTSDKTDSIAHREVPISVDRTQITFSVQLVNSVFARFGRYLPWFGHLKKARSDEQEACSNRSDS